MVENTTLSYIEYSIKKQSYDGSYTFFFWMQWTIVYKIYPMGCWDSNNNCLYP